MENHCDKICTSYITQDKMLHQTCLLKYSRFLIRSILINWRMDLSAVILIPLILIKWRMNRPGAKEYQSKSSPRENLSKASYEF